MAKRYKQFAPFPSCCGAGFDPGAKRFKDFGLDRVKQAASSSRRVFILTDVEVPDSTKIWDGIWLVEVGNEWTPCTYTIPFNEGGITYMYNNCKSLNGKCNVVHGFRDFLNRNIEDVILNKTKEASDLPSFAILAGPGQHKLNEAYLIKLGWSVISRRTSMKTRNNLSLFFRPPGKVKHG